MSNLFHHYTWFWLKYHFLRDLGFLGRVDTS